MWEAIVKPEPESEKEVRDRAPMGTWTKVLDKKEEEEAAV